tara:strand:- start:451 stop:594 length:144 start_codon:yes stop_codon:yes gene_type:complete
MKKEKYNINYQMSKGEIIYRAIRDEIAHKTFMKRLKEKHKQMENNIE